jgi:general secretion pathway protein B
MSFILDALKKSEAERQRQAGPALLEMRVLPPQRRLPLWAIAVGLLLIVNVLVLGWFALRREPAPAAAPPPPAVAAVSAAAAPAALPNATPNTAPVMVPPLVNTDADTGGGAESAAAPAGRSAAAAAAESDNPADNAPAENSAPGTVSIARGPALQNYSELNGKLPELRLDLHVYAANPAERYAFINMHKVREGEVTPEGVRVMEITNDGVVLDYRGTEFLLGHQ